MADLDAQQDIKQTFDDTTEGFVVDTIPGPAGPGNSSKDWEQCVQLGFVDGKWRVVVV